MVTYEEKPDPIQFEGLPGFWFYGKGPFREPQRGEWYLSGAIVQAWQAHYDFTMKYHIAIPVCRAKRVGYWERGKPFIRPGAKP